MALNAAAAWLVAYDIVDPKRLARFHRFLKGHGTPVQYSVFMLRGTLAQIGNLSKDIECRIDRRADDVRIYRIPEPAQVDMQGDLLFPKGITLLPEKAHPFTLLN